jgi:hypothetical protein
MRSSSAKPAHGELISSRWVGASFVVGTIGFALAIASRICSRAAQHARPLPDGSHRRSIEEVRRIFFCNKSTSSLSERVTRRGEQERPNRH